MKKKHAGIECMLKSGIYVVESRCAVHLFSTARVAQRISQIENMVKIYVRSDWEYGKYCMMLGFEPSLARKHTMS